MKSLIPFWAAAALVVWAGPGAAQTAEDEELFRGNSACPEDRVYIEPELTTLPEDGRLYEIQRQAIRMSIRDLVTAMGGIESAQTVAERTRAEAETKIGQGAQGAERRFHQDTILRADALLEILDCLRSGEGA